EKKGRGGKTATVLEGPGLPARGLEDMARRLRRSLGCGAHVEGATIVLTGAQTERVRDWLAGEGATQVVVGN
ncbi:MAG: translation initiation factor, partial [Myxococcales bacterium]|nr:translation initiation factor [Myxococcales bacterium]